MYSRIVEGEPTRPRSELPRNGRLPDGRQVSNYDRLPFSRLYELGWREVIDDGPPEHDPETQRIHRTGYMYDPEQGVVRPTYEILERPDPGDLPIPGIEPDGHYDPMIGAPDA